MPNNAILGYTRTLLRILREQQPDFLVAAFESPTSFRSELFDQYKANRSVTPETLAPQIDYCRRMTEAIGIPTYDVDGFEADDVIGTIAMKMWSRGYPAVIVSGDKDLAHVRTGVRIYTWRMNLACEGGVGNASVEPCQIPDLLALNGDSVDNIPGVRGVGPSTARQILSACLSVEDLAADDALLDSVPMRSRGRILRRILDTMESVRLSRRLATIRCDAPLTVTPDTVRYRRGHREILFPLCENPGWLLLEEIP
jgi:DNA polymerase-1